MKNSQTNRIQPKFERINNGLYKDKIYGLSIFSKGRGNWIISTEKASKVRWIFIGGNELTASLFITGFKTLREAKHFDVIKYVHNTTEKILSEDMLFVCTSYFGILPFCVSVEYSKLVEGVDPILAL